MRSSGRRDSGENHSSLQPVAGNGLLDRRTLLGRGIAAVGNEGSVELGKLETLGDALAIALADGASGFRRTLAGAMVSLKRNCIVIEPVLKAGGIFKNQGRLVIWLTDDDRRLPVLMKSKVSIGSISVVLTEMKRG